MGRTGSGSEEEEAGGDTGWVGFVDLPKQVHRKSVRTGFKLNLLVVGESGLGKSTLVNSLFLTDLYTDRMAVGVEEMVNRTVELDMNTAEIEEGGVRLELTVVDTPGFGDGIDNTDSFSKIVGYIEDQFERYLTAETGLNRHMTTILVIGINHYDWLISYLNLSDLQN